MNPNDQMPFNLAGEAMPEMTSEERESYLDTLAAAHQRIIDLENNDLTEQEWENYCQKIKEENRQKIKEAHKNRNSTSPFK